jgi:hypothetical protein
MKIMPDAFPYLQISVNAQPHKLPVCMNDGAEQKIPG